MISTTKGSSGRGHIEWTSPMLNSSSAIVRSRLHNVNVSRRRIALLDRHALIEPWVNDAGDLPWREREYETSKYLAQKVFPTRIRSLSNGISSWSLSLVGTWRYNWIRSIPVAIKRWISVCVFGAERRRSIVILSSSHWFECTHQENWSRMSIGRVSIQWHGSNRSREAWRSSRSDRKNHRVVEVASAAASRWKSRKTFVIAQILAVL